MKKADIYNVILQNKESILTQWVSSESVAPILENVKMQRDAYKKDIANPILDYFLGIVNLKEAVGDCPIMRKIVETFLDSGLHVEDVFLNCTILKNIIVETLFENNFDKIQVREITSVLDTNLHMLLGVFTKEKIKKDIKFTFHAKLIEEHVALSITDTKGVITYVTDAFCTLSGYSANELLGRTHNIIKHPDMKDEFFKGLWEKLNTKHAWKGKIKNRKKDGGEFIAKTEIIPFKDENGIVVEYVVIRHDITDKELSNIDPLTGLYNRRYYKTIVSTLLNKSAKVSLMMVDIDYFKKINDDFGHNFGDLVLKEFANVLTKKVRGQDICIRWGGEEFLILLPDTELKKATDIANRIRISVEDLIILDKQTGVSVDIKCSIGVSQCNENDDIDSLLERADSNLYEAKNNGRNMVISK